jgi:hypothetical protein
MMHTPLFGFVGAIALALGIAAPAAAQPAIDWFTIDCGGGASTGGGYALSGTIGQPDAAPGITGMSGGGYKLIGGFWPGIPPPCSADFNNSGAVSVQDIFDFLTEYFASDPRADFNHSGAISVQDLFDFLAAYFAGCN